MTALYPNQCYNEMCYTGSSLFLCVRAVQAVARLHNAQAGLSLSWSSL